MCCWSGFNTLKFLMQGANEPANARKRRYRALTTRKSCRLGGAISRLSRAASFAGTAIIGERTSAEAIRPLRASQCLGEQAIDAVILTGEDAECFDALDAKAGRLKAQQ